MYLFSNILGVFVFDDKFNIVDEILFKNLKDYEDKEKFIGQVKNKHKNLKEPDKEALKSILPYFKNSRMRVSSDMRSFASLANSPNSLTTH